MPSNQDEKRAVLPETAASEWTGPVAQVPSLANVPPVDEDDQFEDDELAEETIHTGDLLTPDTSGELLQTPATDPRWTAPRLPGNKDTLGTFWRQFAPLLVPLPFGLLVFLATLPATLQGSPHPTVLVMAILLLALMILQGTLLYFAGSNDTLLTLAIVGGGVLFVAAGVFAAFGPLPALLTLGILLLAGLLLARRGMRITRMGYVDIVTSFGKYSHTLEPGLNLLLPWERAEYSLNIQETSWTTPKMEVPTARNQKVELTATICYQLLPEDAYLAATSVKNWEDSLQTLFCGTVQSVVNELKPEDFVTWTQSIYARPAPGESSAFNPAAATRWDRINGTLARRMQDHIASCGIQVHWVRIQDLTLLPAAFGESVLSLNGSTGGTTQIMKNHEPLTPPAVSPPSPPTAESAPPAPAASPAPAPAPRRAPAAALPPAVEALVNMYEAVRQNKITEPTVIDELAQRFEALASDPVTNKNIDFDAARAAATLRQRAQKIQVRSGASS